MTEKIVFNGKTYALRKFILMETMSTLIKPCSVCGSPVIPGQICIFCVTDKLNEEKGK